MYTTRSTTCNFKVHANCRFIISIYCIHCMVYIYPFQFKVHCQILTFDNSYFLQLCIFLVKGHSLVPVNCLFLVYKHNNIHHTELHSSNSMLKVKPSINNHNIRGFKHVLLNLTKHFFEIILCFNIVTLDMILILDLLLLEHLYEYGNY